MAEQKKRRVVIGAPKCRCLIHALQWLDARTPLAPLPAAVGSWTTSALRGGGELRRTDRQLGRIPSASPLTTAVQVPGPAPFADNPTPAHMPAMDDFGEPAYGHVDMHSPIIELTRLFALLRTNHGPNRPLLHPHIPRCSLVRRAPCSFSLHCENSPRL
jgi:hypothetical protein